MGGVVALGKGVWRIPTAGDYINSFVFMEHDGSVTLVDTGVPWAGRKVINGLAQLGKHPRDVARVILTHAHMDHAGSAASLLKQTRADGATVHQDDAALIRSGKPAPGSGRLGLMMVKLPYQGYKPVPVTHEVHDGDVIDVAGGLIVHHTPGHTPGHISLLHPDSGVLITGDSIFNMNNRRSWPIKYVCTDFPLNQRTAAVLADVEYSTAAFTHGPHIAGSGREQVRDFLRREGVVR